MLLGFVLQSIQRIFLILFAAMGVQKMLVEWRFWSKLLILAVKLAVMFFGLPMHVLSWFALVASTFEVFGAIRGLQAEEARDSITHSISPTVDLFSWNLPRSAFCIRALHWFTLKGIRIDQRPLQSFTSSFDFLYRKLFPSSLRDEDAWLPKDSLQPLGRYNGLTLAFSAFKIFPYPWKPGIRISARKGSL